MGYETKSIWTQLRSKDIKELNEIIDDEYCRELEIGRKLNIMKKFKAEFNKEINSLNWEAITNYMKEHNWVWYMGGSLDNLAIPTKEEMIESLKINFLKHGLYEIIELGKGSYSSSSGGFNVEMGYIGNSYWVNIYFDIAHF